MTCCMPASFGIYPIEVPVYAGYSEIDQLKDNFIVVGDTQSTSRWEFWRERNNKEREAIINEITKRRPAFVIHLGDLTTRGSSEKHWREFDEMHKDFRKQNIPYFPILGNHEFYGNDEKALENYFSRFPHLKRQRWYSFRWKKIGIIMVDSNFSTMSKEQIEIQNRWYSKEIERFDRDSEIDYIIVCCHEPPFTNSRVVSPNRKTRKYFAELYIKSRKGTLFLSGHSHTYEHFKEEGKDFIVSGGGGGPRHKVSIDSEQQKYRDLFKGAELRFFHFCQIRVNSKTLYCEVISLQLDNRFSIVDSLRNSRK